MNTARLITWLATACTLLALLAAWPADAQAPTGYDTPVEVVVRADPGTRVMLAEITTPADLVGGRCTLTYREVNNASVHPDTELHVGALTLSDVESAPNKVTVGAQPFTAGESLAMSVTVGPDGVVSLGGVLSVHDCITPVPPTVTTPPTVTVPPTVPPTVTTSPPRCVQVSDVPGAALACEHVPDLTG